jgi:hypothetical protein
MAGLGQGQTPSSSRGHCLQFQTLLAAARRLNGFEQWRKAKPFSRRLSQICKRQSAKSFAASPSHRSKGDFRVPRPQAASPHLAARFNPSYRLKRRHRTQVSYQMAPRGGEHVVGVAAGFELREHVPAVCVKHKHPGRLAGHDHQQICVLTERHGKIGPRIG